MNKMFSDFMPAIVFFAVYKIYDIYYATTALIIVTIAQVIYEYIFHKKVAKAQIFIVIFVVIFGGATLYFHNSLFIKWKVSIINWLFGLILIFSQYILKINIIEKLLAKNITLDKKDWSKLNQFWYIYFILLGFINIFIALNFSTDVWMNFKLFGIIGISFLFIVLQSLYITKYAKK